MNPAGEIKVSVICGPDEKPAVLRALTKRDSAIRIVPRFLLTTEEAIRTAAAIRPQLFVALLANRADEPMDIPTVATLRSGRPGIPILVVGPADPDTLYHALAAGARGYVVFSSTGLAHLAAGIAAMVLERTFCLGPIAAGMVAHSIGRLQAGALGCEKLSPRELELLGHVSRGLIDKEIADLMQISPNTVHNHFKNICEKLEVPNRAAAVAKFMIWSVLHGIHAQPGAESALR